MLNRLWVIDKVLPTVLIFVGFLTTMNSVMTDELWALRIGFPTNLTWVRFYGVHLSRHIMIWVGEMSSVPCTMSFHMGLEIWVLTENFPTLCVVAEFVCTVASALLIKGGIRVRQFLRFIKGFLLCEGAKKDDFAILTISRTPSFPKVQNHEF